jgi:CRP-like cAMP-binding protein
MLTSLKFLTEEDYHLLWSKAEIASYQKNEIILAEGCFSEAIYLVRQGNVRIERANSGSGIAIATLHPGDIFGEMSLLTQMETNAAVVAEEQVEVNILDKTTLYSLLQSIPGLSARFYQSLAYSLSLRLQETSALVSSLMKQTSSLQQLPSRRTGCNGYNSVPPELISEVELFRKNLVGIERSLRSKQLSKEETQELITKNCNFLVDSWREQIINEPELEQAIGNYVFRETFPFFMLSSFIDCAFRKPRGYIGDAQIIEILSQNEPEGDGHLGNYIDRWIRSIPTSIALKNRGRIITATIKELASHWNYSHPMPVTSLASGSVTEILDLYFQTTPPNVHITCVDINHRYLAYAANLSEKLGFSHCLTWRQDSVTLLSQGHNHINIPPQQMIYSLSLSNYFADEELIPILNWIYEHLLPQGTLVLGNFHAANSDRFLLEHILEWRLYYRCAERIERLFAQSKFNSLPLTIQSDEYGAELFVVCTKSWQ